MESPQPIASPVISFEEELDAVVRELALTTARLALKQARRLEACLDAPDTPEATRHAENRALVALIRAARSLLPKSGRALPEVELPEAAPEFAAHAPEPPDLPLSRPQRRALARVGLRQPFRAFAG